MKTFKIVLIGEGGVGKSTWIRRLQTGEFEKKYVATLGVEVHPIHVRTNYGAVCLNFWDCAGQEKFGGLRDGYFVKADGAIVMFDQTSTHTLNQVPKWVASFRRTIGCHNRPIVLVGTKVDVPHLKVKPSPEYLSISTKSCHHLYEPIETLLRILMGKEDLVILP